MMVWATFQGVGRFIRNRQIHIITTSATVAAAGLVLYEKLKDQRVACAEHRNQFVARGSEIVENWDENWDKRDPKSLVELLSTKNKRDYDNEVKKRTPKATQHLILISPAQSVYTDKKDILTTLGRQQARWTGRWLRALKGNKTHIVSTTNLPAAETAHIIHTYLPTIKTLNYIDEVLLEGDLFTANQSDRIESVFRKYFHRADPEQKDDSVVVIVCPENAIVYFINRAMQVSLEIMVFINLSILVPLPHASVTHLMILPDGDVILQDDCYVND